MNSPTIVPLDTEFDGLPGAVAAYLIEGPEPTLVDPGPTTCLSTVRAAVEARGMTLKDIRHVVLTHVHLDHAGATGDLVALNPDLVVHMHEEGAPFLVDPELLVASTRRTWGDIFDSLFGVTRPIPGERIEVWQGQSGVHAGAGRSTSPVEKATGLRGIHTPGHIDHHLAFLDERSGLLFSGDSLGLRLANDAPVVASCPPPSVDMAAWMRTLDELEAIGAEQIAHTHFGLRPTSPAATSGARVEATRGMVEAYREVLVGLATRVRAALGAGQTESDATRYATEVRDKLGPYRDDGWLDHYFRIFSAINDYQGVQRYLEKNPGWSAGA